MIVSPVVPSLARTQPANGRITIVLIPAVQDELRQLQELTKLSRTDLTNRAISLYDFFERRLRVGDQLMVRSGRTGKLQVVDYW
jgi:hypothetical protein